MPVLAAPTQSTPPASFPEIMTLQETARFLRVSPKTIVRLVKEGKLPARKVGHSVRFSQTALIRWFAWDLPSKIPQAKTPRPSQLISSTLGEGKDHKLTNTIQEKPLSVAMMPTIKGKGTDSETPEGNASTPDTSKPIGSRPELNTAQEIFLRDQEVLLKPNQITLEVDFFYTKTEQNGAVLVGVGPGPDLVNAFSPAEQDIVTSVYTIRYGLPFDAQAVASVPLIYREGNTLILSPGSNSSSNIQSDLTEFGDVTLELNQTVIKEKAGIPSILLRVEGRIPTRLSSYSVGGGVALVKQFDPAALFSNVNYRYVFNRTFIDTSRLQPDHIVDMQAGFALSMNDTLALNASVIGVFTSAKSFTTPFPVQLRSNETISLRLGLTTYISESLYVEPSVEFSLTEPSSVTLGLNLPYTFSVPSFFN